MAVDLATLRLAVFILIVSLFFYIRTMLLSGKTPVHSQYDQSFLTGFALFAKSMEVPV